MGLDADGDAAITWGEVQARSEEIAATRCAASQSKPTARRAVARAPEIRGPARRGRVRGARPASAVPRPLRALRVTTASCSTWIPHAAASCRARSAARARPPCCPLSGRRSRASSAAVAVDELRAIRDGRRLAHLARLRPPRVRHAARAADRARPARRGSREPGVRGAIGSRARRHRVHRGPLLDARTRALGSSACRRTPESAIALSVLVGAPLNVLPTVPRLGAKLAFGFGLVHGPGFATALGDLGAGEAGIGESRGVQRRRGARGSSAVVGALLPVLFALRSHRVRTRDRELCMLRGVRRARGRLARAAAAEIAGRRSAGAKPAGARRACGRFRSAVSCAGGCSPASPRPVRRRR